jgi:hypothetical protein
VVPAVVRESSRNFSVTGFKIDGAAVAALQQ